MLIFLGCAMIDVGTFQDFAYLTSISHHEISMIFFFSFPFLTRRNWLDSKWLMLIEHLKIYYLNFFWACSTICVK
jgi:hypothetical protein